MKRRGERGREASRIKDGEEGTTTKNSPKKPINKYRRNAFFDFATVVLLLHFHFHFIFRTCINIGIPMC